MRLHRSSLIVGLATLVVLTLIVVPGVDVSTYFAHSSTPALLQHGWPRQFIERRIDWDTPWWNQSTNQAGYPAKGLYGIPWMSLTTWRFWEGAIVFSWKALAFDIVLAVGITGITVALWERRRRRRASAWQFRLVEALIAMTVLAAALAWLTWQRAEHNRELAIELYFDDLNYTSNFTPTIGFVGDHAAPQWLQRLVGVQLLPDYLYRLDEAYFHGLDSDADCIVYQEVMMPRLKSIRRLHTLEFHGDIADMTAIFQTLGEWHQLRTLDLLWCSKLSLTASNANQLAKLSWLTKIRLHDRQCISEKAQRIINQRMPQCEIDYLNNW